MREEYEWLAVHYQRRARLARLPHRKAWLYAMARHYLFTAIGLPR